MGRSRLQLFRMLSVPRVILPLPFLARGVNIYHRNKPLTCFVFID